MKDLNYGKNYKYSHDFSGNFEEQEYLPESLQGTKLFTPGDNSQEEKLQKRLKELWKDKYEY